MPHALCFTDLSLDNSSRCCTELFVRDDNKKSSFAISQPYSLVTHHAESNDTTEKKSASVVTAVASITSCITANNSDTDDNDATDNIIIYQSEMFLFAGFELLANTKTVEVYVIRSSNDNDTNTNAAATVKKIKEEDETYLTTCNGVPQRDLPPLTSIPQQTNNDGRIEEQEERKATNDTNTTSIAADDLFYKFIFVSPGGLSKPVLRVRLKFVKSDGHSQSNIIVRALKVKGRLDLPSPQKQQSMQLQQQSIPFGAQTNNGGMRGMHSSDMNSLASMMAMMGGGNTGASASMGIPMTTQQQQMELPQQMQQLSNKQYQQQNQLHLQEKNQAELISSIAGLGLYLKSSEERAEQMLSRMEERIMERLDDLSDRMSVIEESIQLKDKEKTDAR